MKTLLATCLLLLANLPLSAQFSGGFRAGLNFNTFDGPQETSSVDGTTWETFNRTTGFHVGATFAYAITDLVGFKADLMYTQKGAEALYDGPSYFYLYDLRGDNDTEDRVQGLLSSERDVVNSYIEVPLVAYYRIGPLEIEGGVSTGLLVNSRASGGGKFTNNLAADGNAVRDITFNYDYNYFRDGVGKESALEVSDTPLAPGVDIFPPSVLGAYYNSDNDEPLYKRLDFGLIGGLAFYLNNGLFIGARYQYGLTDVTRGENDRRRSTENSSGEREYNTDDKDYNRVIQASIGFRF